jgi:hypothetical protein
MTEQELAEIEKRWRNARGGPWKSFVEGRGHTSGSSFIKVGDSATRSDDIELTGATVEDQDFIAAAKQDIPALIEEIKQLKRLL